MRKTAARIVLALSVLLTLLPCASAQTTVKEDLDKVMDLEAEFMKATAERGSAGYISYYAENAVELPDGAPMIEGKEAIRKAMGFLDEGNVLTWQPLKAAMAPSRDLAYTFGTYEYRGKDKDGKPIIAHGKYVTIWERQSDGSWKVAVDMGNSNGEN